MFFDDLEAVKIATAMEQSGLDFYTRAAEKTADPYVKKMFLRLAGEERQHLTLFEELQKKLSQEPRHPAGVEDDETAAYVQHLVDSHVFSEKGTPARLLAEAADDIAALAVGIRAERDALLFYQEMINFTDSQAAVAAFEQIIAEERQHLAILAEASRRCHELHG
jgi:rubrerythrin